MGNGNYGEVRKCKHVKSGAVRAVKIVKLDKLEQFEKKLLIHEIELLKRLDHPNILKLNEVFQDEKRLYIVTELCTGGELFDEVTIRRQLEERSAAVITR